MATQRNPNSLKNLEKGKKTRFKSGENAVTNGRKGGIANGMRYKTGKALVGALLVGFNQQVFDKEGKPIVIWDGLRDMALKAGLTNGRFALELIKLGITLNEDNREQTINLIQTKDKATVASEIKIAQAIIKQLQK